MKRFLILVILAIVLFSFIVIQSSDAETIGLYHYHHIIRPEHTPVAEPTTAKLYYGPYSNGSIIGGEYDPPWGPVFSIELKYDDVGKIYTTNSGVAYQVAVESMINGTLDSASWSGFNRGMGGPESSLWLPIESNFGDDGYGFNIYGYYAGHNGFDFEGFIIDSISFSLETFDPRNIEFTIALSGRPVPEPATLLLLGAGLVGLAGFGRKRFKK